ncbi:MAG: conjugal transfer protein [Neisseria sp.]|uniref:conjugal transfer protein n=1 Tax=Neisseria sp. TaxID=192066 RepID=UPI0026DBE9B2|nr:conjugal transfer protein [Neisseria sp.]MDO4248314.1 conjugal transfer protein [Neisseria sp.]
MNPHILPDTRPYPADPVKNELLLYANQIAEGRGGAQSKLAQESLRAAIYGMFKQNHYLGLSVAMSMAPSAAAYRALLDNLDNVLQAKTDEEVQWFALPVILVAGGGRDINLKTDAPVIELAACLANYPHTRALAHAAWLPQLVSSSRLSAVNAGQWFAAKQSAQAAAGFAATFAADDLPIPSGQSVHVAFALGYGDRSVQSVLGTNLRNAALPLMQVWQENLTVPNLTLFANPLPPAAPLLALAEGSHMRLRMALDVFAANAIRAVRLQSPRVGVVMAAQAGGRLLFGFGATDQSFGLQNQVFSWPLSPAEHIETVQQDFLDLMVECQVEHIRLLHNPLPENGELPDYGQALKLAGHNPLFADPARAS